MVKLNKNRIILLLALTFCFVMAGLSVSVFNNKKVYAETEIQTGVVIDMTTKSYYDCRVYDAADFYAEQGSKILSNPTFKIRYAGDNGGYIIYAVDIPYDAKHFYVDGVFGGEGAMLISTDENFEESVMFDPECGVGHKYLTFDVFGEDYFNGKPTSNRLYFKLGAHPTRGKSLQIIDRLRFIHDGTVTEDRFFPEVYVEKKNGFYSNVKDLNDGDYRIYGEKIMDTYKGVAYNTYISNGEVGNNLSHCTYAFMDAPYGVYKFTVPKDDTAGYEFSNLMLNADIWGMFRISVSTGLKIQSEDVAAYTSLDLWEDIKCGSTDADKQTYVLDITKFLDSSNTIYIRVTDSSDNDQEDGGAYISALSISSIYKYVGEPIMDIPKELNSGVVGYPVDLSVIGARSGLEGYSADTSFVITAPNGAAVEVNPSGISFTPEVFGDYVVNVIATDGNLNEKAETITISVREAAKIKEISVAKKPSAEKFLYNKQIDLSGGRIKISFEDNTETYISMLDCSPSLDKLTRIGLNTLTLSFEINGENESCNLDLECIDYIRQIEVYSSENTNYFTGYEGGVANGNEFDYIIVDMGDEDVSYNGYYSTDTGEQTLTIRYHGCECSFKINVEKDVLLGVELIKNPKITYEIGEVIDLRDGVLKLTYQSGRIAEISLSNNDVYFDGYDNTAGGKQTVKFEYNGFAFDLDVEVVGDDQGGGNGQDGTPNGCGSNVGTNGSLLLIAFIIYIVFVLIKKCNAKITE